MSDYNTGNSASTSDYNRRSSYECYDCKQSLNDNETYEANGGKIYCGTYYQSQ
jgi:hypothetical protein